MRCAFCNDCIDGRRPQARFCSGACRASASRQRAVEKASAVEPLVMPSTARETAQEPHSGAMWPDAGTEAVGQGVNHVQPFLEPPCADPLRCRFLLRHPNGPWTCAFNHPRVAPEARRHE
jgi:hypothetical protein